MEERLLILYGWPVNDAISMCHSLRRQGMLPEFMEQERENYLKRLGRCPEISDNSEEERS